MLNIDKILHHVFYRFVVLLNSHTSKEVSRTHFGKASLSRNFPIENIKKIFASALHLDLSWNIENYFDWGVQNK